MGLNIGRVAIKAPDEVAFFFLIYLLAQRAKEDVNFYCNENSQERIKADNKQTKTPQKGVLSY